MDKAQYRIFKQALRLQHFGAESSVLQKDTFYQKAHQKLLHLVTQLEELNINQDHSKSKIAYKKQDSREQLETLSFQVASLLKSYGNFHEFIPFSSLKGFGKNQLYKYSGINLLINSEKLKGILDEYPDESIKAKVGSALKEALMNSIALFDDLLEDPKRNKKKLKRTGEKIQESLKQYQNLLNDVIIPYVKGKYAGENPKLVSRMESVLKYNKIPRRKISLAGTIKDEEGRPIHRPRLTVDKKKPMVKRGTKGNYFIKNLTSGQHSLIFTCKNYKTVKKAVMITNDSVYRLDVVMVAENSEQ
ncbi:carboxypeptidase-like regulatory domain-containing protein [Marinifilum flexuosum]|uniref:carboxypeptidase-like regulatory domain-containing protein n=1 Tax=Marinifilum flexuosum TaxID=1117708 RepID=UPI0024915ABC|nr:carboxypeptidase-like regulatory domain-containing protein [Marinifilum flexuosum]